MLAEKKIQISFLLNLFFAVVEFAGGALTGSIAIMSDAVHDLGDAFSIGVSWFLEKKSRKQPDDVFTFGYARYSVMGGVITTVVLLAGSVLVIAQAVKRILNPSRIHYDGMIALGIFAVIVNCAAAFLTRSGDSLNQKAVNLHMLEDVLGWLVVLAGAGIMRFTGWTVLDPVMSIAVSLFILAESLKNLKEILDVFLEKVPRDISTSELREHLLDLEGVEDIHHLHLWTMDGQRHYATLHAVTREQPELIRARIRQECREHGIGHVTVETERPGDQCEMPLCYVETETVTEPHHHHLHHK